MSYWPKAYTWHRPDFRYAWTNPEPKLGWPEHGSLSGFVGDNSIGRGLGPESNWAWVCPPSWSWYPRL